MRKDETDAELAVAQAAARYPGEVVLLGALGGALDHVLGHLCILRGLADAGRVGRIAAPGLAATVLRAPATVRLGSRRRHAGLGWWRSRPTSCSRCAASTTS